MRLYDLAGYKAVGDAVKSPLKILPETLRLPHRCSIVMDTHGVSKIVFSSSGNAASHVVPVTEGCETGELYKSWWSDYGFKRRC